MHIRYASHWAKPSASQNLLHIIYRIDSMQRLLNSKMLSMDQELLLATYLFVLADHRIPIIRQPARSHGTGRQFVTDLE